MTDLFFLNGISTHLGLFDAKNLGIRIYFNTF